MEKSAGKNEDVRMLVYLQGFFFIFFFFFTFECYISLDIRIEY